MNDHLNPNLANLFTKSFTTISEKETLEFTVRHENNIYQLCHVIVDDHVDTCFHRKIDGIDSVDKIIQYVTDLDFVNIHVGKTVISKDELFDEELVKPCR